MNAATFHTVVSLQRKGYNNKKQTGNLKHAKFGKESSGHISVVEQPVTVQKNMESSS